MNTVLGPTQRLLFWIPDLKVGDYVLYTLNANSGNSENDELVVAQYTYSRSRLGMPSFLALCNYTAVSRNGRSVSGSSTMIDFSEGNHHFVTSAYKITKAQYDFIRTLYGYNQR